MTGDSGKLIVIGAGGHARVVIDAAKANGFSLCGIIDTDYKGQEERILGCPVIGDLDSLSRFDPKETAVTIAIGDRQKRADLFYRVEKLGYNMPVIIHPTAIISKHTSIGKGVFINAGVIINANAEIDANTIINTGAIIEHEVVIGKHCHVCPGVKIGGRVSIGDNTIIGIGASVIDRIKIGQNVIVGAGSVIIRDIESNSTVAGVPGKQIK